MSARLAEPQEQYPPERGIWEGLWQVQRLETLSDLGRAGMAAEELQVLEGTLFDKYRSPVDAAIASTVLLRSGALVVSVSTADALPSRRV